MSTQIGELPEIEIRGWRLVLITHHGIRVWWHLQRNEPWVAGVMPGMSRATRQYVMDALRAANKGQPAPPVPDTEDPVIPEDAWSGLFELDTATLIEGDPV